MFCNVTSVLQIAVLWRSLKLFFAVCRAVESEFLVNKLISLQLSIFKTFWSELESSKKQAEVDKKAIDDLVRERDILNKVFCFALQFYKWIFDYP